MSITLGRPAAIAGTVAATIGLGWAIGSATVGAQTSTEKSKKTSIAGGTTEVVAPQERVLLLSEKIRTTKYTDLLLGVTAECAITTELTTVGNDDAGASGLVNVWIEIDGKPISVTDTDRNFATPEQGDDGKITFCNRAEGRTTSMFDDEDATIKTYNRTKEASAFNWAALNVGPANVVHTISVYGELTTSTTGDATAMAAIGDRTLIVEPVKAAKDEQIIDLDTSGT